MSRETASAPPRLGLPWEPGDRAPLTGDWWARGLNLAERVAAGPVPPAAEAGSDRTDRAVKRLERWRAAHPDVPADVLAAQLDDLDLTEDGLLALLAEEPAALAARAPRPGWADDVRRIVAAMPEDGVDVPGDLSDWRQGFAVVVAPFAAAAVAELHAGGVLAQVADLLDVETFLRDFRDWLTRQFVDIAARVLVLEMNVRRVSGGLDGNDPAARFRSFVRLMTVPESLAYLLDEYVVLARRMATLSTLAAHAQIEFCRRLAADRSRFVADVFGSDPGRVTEVSFGGGDAHDGGRAVASLTFADGRRLVYKPRPITLHRRFNETVDWYDGLLPETGLRTLAVVDRGDYGWIEFADAGECADEAGAERFFRRSGALLALLHVLGGTDFHHENIIAAGDQPVVIDLEALFQAEFPDRGAGFGLPTDPASRVHRDSVSQIGLLPSVVTGPNGDAIDIGGMGADGGFLAPYETVGWADAGTDEMRMSRSRRVFRGARNRPRLGGEPLDPCAYAPQFRAGFTAGYRALLEHREALLASDGPLAAFNGCRNRFLARPTRVYMQMLIESNHPDVTRDALDREWIFGLLWGLSDEDDALRRLVPHELADLWNGDVPMFHGTIDGDEVITSGHEALGGLLAVTGEHRARRIVAAMSETDLARQEWIIDAAMATRSPMRAAPTGAASMHWTGIGEGGRREDRALRLAVRVGDLLADRACRDGDRTGWLGLDLVGGTSWSVNPIGSDLYGGLSGVALFLAELAAATGEDGFAELARASIDAVRERAEAFLRPGFPTEGLLCGAYTGVSGMAYALDAIAGLLGEPGLTARVGALLELTTRLVADDEQIDVIGGAAGALAVAEALVAGYGGPAEALAAAAAARLVALAVPQGVGVAWRTPMAAETPLLGMSHGAGGVATALLRHGARVGDPSALHTGYAAMTYERSEFRAEMNNWPDFREKPTLPWETPQDGPAFMHAWCHGAPGIGLARAGVPEELRTSELRGDLETAVRSLAASAPSGNHSLCHGSLGNLELFAQAARLGIGEAPAAYDRHADAIVAGIDRTGPLCGTPRSVPTPGLMSGLAGIGHGLLRIARPDRVPSVLLLEDRR